jgi:hypothetical protein
VRIKTSQDSRGWYAYLWHEKAGVQLLQLLLGCLIASAAGAAKMQAGEPIASMAHRAR